MNLPDVLLIGVFVVVGVLGFLVILFALMYFKVREDLDKSQQKLKETETQAENKEVAVVVVEQAQQEARRVIQEASNKASDILKESRYLSDKVKTTLEADLSRLPQAQEDIYRQVFKKVGDEAIGILQRVAEDMKMQAQQQTRDFGLTLQKQAELSQEDVKKSIDSVYEHLEEDVNKYKSQRFAQIDRAVHRVIEDIVREVLGRAISAQEHEQLILQALDEARRSNAL